MLSPLRKFRPAATKLKASEVGPTRETSSGWQFNNFAPALRASAIRCMTNASWSPSVPPSAHSLMGDAARQGTNAGVAQKNFIFRDGKFMMAEFLVRQNFREGHNLLEAVQRRVEIAHIESDHKDADRDGNGEVDDKINDAAEGLQLAEAFLLEIGVETLERFVHFAADLTRVVKLHEHVRKIADLRHHVGGRRAVFELGCPFENLAFQVGRPASGGGQFPASDHGHTRAQ